MTFDEVWLHSRNAIVHGRERRRMVKIVLFCDISHRFGVCAGRFAASKTSWRSFWPPDVGRPARLSRASGQAASAPVLIVGFGKHQIENVLAAANAEFLVNMRNMSLHGIFRQYEFILYIGTRAALGEQREYFGFSRR